MLFNMIHGKIHRATVTEADLNYVGSITVDADLLEASGIHVGELVHIVNINNGARIETYTIAGERGSGVICLNGAAARHFCIGDKVIIMAYAMCNVQEANELKPKVVFVDADNKISSTSYEEKAHTSYVN